MTECTDEELVEQSDLARAQENLELAESAPPESTVISDWLWVTLRMALAKVRLQAEEVERLRSAAAYERLLGFRVLEQLERATVLAEEQSKINARAVEVAEALGAEVERLKLRPPMHCSACEDLNLKLADELETLRPVYAVAARLRTFPVPFDEHLALVDAVDHARDGWVSGEDISDEDFQKLLAQMRPKECECNDYPHAGYCPARCSTSWTPST